MKIAFATDYIPEHHDIWGGGEQACLRLYEMLSKNGHNLTILSTKPNKTPDANLNFQRVRVIDDLLPRKLKYQARQTKSAFFPLDILSLFSSYFVIRKAKPDILHFHNIHSLSLSLLVVARLLKIPTVISVYDYWIVCPIGFLWKIEDFGSYEGTNCHEFHGVRCIKCVVKQKSYLKLFTPFLVAFLGFRKKLLDKLLKKMDGFIVLSQSNADILEEYGINRNKIGVVQIPLGAENLNSEIEDNSILFIGWLHPRKGPHVVVKAMPHILKEIPGARLYMFGDQAGNQEYKESILSFIKQNNLDSNIFLLGKQPHDAVKEYLRKASVLVIPETWETIAPNTLTEGLTYGKAIVASRVGGSKDYIDEGKNGLLAENNNPVDFADKILSILKDKDLLMRLSKNAVKSREQLFSEEKVYHRLMNFYDNVCRESSLEK